MIDAKARHPAARDELGHERVGGVEHPGILHPQGDELVDVEESPVVDLVERRAPVREPIGLVLEQLVEQVEAGGSPGVPFARATQRSMCRRMPASGRKAGQPLARHFFLALPLDNRAAIALGVGRQILKRRQDA